MTPMEEINSHQDNEANLLFPAPSEVPNPSINLRTKKKITGTNSFLLHLGLLLRKNYLVQKRSLKSLIIQLLAPIFICLIVYILQLSANSVVGQAIEEPPINPIGKIPQCFLNEENPTNCSTITYGIVVSLIASI